MSEQRLKLAVFIDFDNVEIGVKTTLGLQFDVGAVLEAIKERGEIITKVAYGDWKRAGEHSRAMSQHAVRMVQRVMTPGGDKNGADINLALDALEMAFTHDHINAFVIVGGDSDFITLVEKLKQYDKKVFVVGGRAFSSQVMQKNCTEFIAYENVAGKGGAPRAERGRVAAAASQSLDNALPLVRRALKVLTDREVSPQLGLLKSTLLQLDSSFSERDYGASTFRDFAEKLEKRGLVTLKHSGRTTVVELADGASLETPETIPPVQEASAFLPVDVSARAGALPIGRSAPTNGDEPAAPEEPVTELTLADGVTLVRQVLAEATTPPRWPMYLRQMKQFIRNARPDFDERRYGSLQDLLRACQKAGLVRLERDRQGGLRAFAGASKPYVPAGWVAPEGETSADVQDATSGAIDGVMTTEGDVTATQSVHGDDGTAFENLGSAMGSSTFAESAPSSVEGRDDEPEGDDQLAMFGVVRPTDPEPAKATKRPSARRARKAAPAIADRPKRARKTPSRTKN
ncbi:MAG TPA: NYN domain-containing protein [Vicinamibacterales bacterium]|nr:NYN domain-containing protein [Vicinamibacterales bacterium]